MKLFLAIGAVVLSIAPAHAQTAGDWVLARWKGGQHWFPGVVQTVSGGKLTIEYDDGDRETLNVKAVKPYNWAIGSRVECDFKGKGWYSGKITALGGEKLTIAYDDGDRETTRTGRCRSE